MQNLILQEQYRDFVISKFYFDHPQGQHADPFEQPLPVGTSTQTGELETPLSPVIDKALPRIAASNVPPEQRFRFVNGVDTPFPLYDKEEMRARNINLADLESADVREISAEWAVLKMDKARKERHDKARMKRDVTRERRGASPKDRDV